MGYFLYIRALRVEISQHIHHLAAKLGASLTNNGLMITTAESCTGGGISYALTDTPGSSAYIDRCFVTYSNQAKMDLLAVSETTLAQFGAVSEQTVIEMAHGASKRTGADIAIAVSGIAGPGGGTDEKPVGTVWMALKVLDECTVYHRVFSGGRASVRVQVVEFVIEKAINLIKDQKKLDTV